MSLGLGIFAFVILCIIGVQFMLNKEVIPLDLQSSKEGFSSGGVTRAADCNCLPGYIASKSPGSEYNGKIFNVIFKVDGKDFSTYMFVPDGTNESFQIKPTNSCGLPDRNTPNNGKYPIISWQDFQVKYPGGRWLDCDIVKTSEKTDSKNYFCQNLGDPKKTRSCY